jgi:hypothetical protein
MFSREGRIHLGVETKTELELAFERNLKDRLSKNKLSMERNTKTNGPRNKNKLSSARNEFSFYISTLKSYTV